MISCRDQIAIEVIDVMKGSIFNPFYAFQDRWMEFSHFFSFKLCMGEYKTCYTHARELLLLVQYPSVENDRCLDQTGYEPSSPWRGIQGLLKRVQNLYGVIWRPFLCSCVQSICYYELSRETQGRFMYLGTSHPRHERGALLWHSQSTQSTIVSTFPGTQPTRGCGWSTRGPWVLCRSTTRPSTHKWKPSAWTLGEKPYIHSLPDRFIFRDFGSRCKSIWAVVCCDKTRARFFRFTVYHGMRIVVWRQTWAAWRWSQQGLKSLTYIYIPKSNHTRHVD